MSLDENLEKVRQCIAETEAMDRRHAAESKIILQHNDLEGAVEYQQHRQFVQERIELIHHGHKCFFAGISAGIAVVMVGAIAVQYLGKYFL